MQAVRVGPQGKPSVKKVDPLLKYNTYKELWEKQRYARLCIAVSEIY